MSRFVHMVAAANAVETVTDNIPLTRIAVSGPAPRSSRSIAAAVTCLLTVLTISSLLFFSMAALAQSDVGTIVGFVRDQSGAVVPNATVTIRNEGTGELHSVTSDEAGHYVAPSLLPTYYSMTTEAKGFEKFTSSHNKLDSNSTIEIDANLSVGAETQTVEVTGTASVLQTQSGAVQSEVTGQQVQNQELNGRNPLYMAQFLPGVRATSSLGDFNFAVGGGQPFQINGARTQDTMVTFDGARAVRTRGNGAIIGVASVDAVQEIQVITANYSPEYGSAAGGQVRVVTRSGTADFHGGLYEYIRNSAMNANTWTRNQSPTTRFASPFVYNNFGFAVSGPVWIPKVGFTEKLRKRFFWFVNEDWIRYRFADTQTQAVPTALMRQGSFSELLSPSNPWYKPAQGVIYDPATCPKLGASTCVPYPNNTIPAGKLSPNGIAILNAYPGPTPGYQSGGTANWIGQAAHPINQRKEVINVDFIPNEKHHIEFRRSDATYFEYQPFDQGSGLTGKYFNRPNQTNAVGWTWTLNSSLINEARASLSLDDVYIPVNTALAGFNRQTLGIDFPYILPGGKAAPNKIPTVNVPTFYGLAGGPYPSHSSGPIYTASDSLTKVWRNHTVKAGFSFEYSGENDNDQINVATVPGGSSNQNGTFVFTDSRSGLGGTSGVGLANLALGLADTYTEIGPKSYTAWRGKLFEEFIQDAWQITPKLHIDYGFRITSTVPYYPLWGNSDYFDPASYNPGQAPQVNPTTGLVTLGTGNPYNGMVIPGISKFPSSATQGNRVPAANPANNACAGQPCTGLFGPQFSKGYVTTTNQFQPRLGIAYQLNPKTVIRAAGGEFVTRMGLLDNIFPGGNSPFQPFLTVSNVSVDNPGASLTPNINAPLTVTTLAKNLVPPSRWNWNLTIERELPLNSVLSVAYVGARGLHNWRVFDINQPAAGALQANPGKNQYYLRPYQGYGPIQQEQSNGSALYSSLQVSWNRRFTAGSMFGVSYTLSKSLDNSSNYRDIMPYTAYSNNLWGPSEYDTRHALIVNYLYELPFFKSQQTLTGKLAGGWTLSGATQFQTGTPCGVGTNNDFAGVGEFGSFGCGGNTSEGQFWVRNGTPSMPKKFGGNGTNFKYFNPTNGNGQPIFTQPAAGTFNLQSGIRDEIYGPGLQDWNLNLFKKFAINERTGFEFRAEAYNFINHPNWATNGPSAPSGQSGGLQLNPTSSQFGEVTQKSVGNPRQLQLNLRYFF
jgi:Carboxypeptidase regulatory-like domain/TonB-dependent Receptor Plug Domain